MSEVKLRASHAPIWSKCPASIDLPRLEPDDQTAALEGDAVHNLAFNMANNTAASRTDTVITDEMWEAAQDFVNYCTVLQCDLEATEITFVSDTMPTEVGGTADFIGYDTTSHTLHVVDLKYGYSSVAAKDNAQLLVYSLGAVGYFKQQGTLKIKLHIYQPRDYINGTVKVWELGSVDWAERIDDLKNRAGAALFSSVANTGDHCRYCKSRVYCKAFLTSASAVLETVQTRPEALKLTANAIGAEYEYLVRAEALAKSARKGFEELITQNIESGTVIPGWKIGSTNGRYKWSAQLKEIKSVETLLGVKLTEEKPVSLTVARKNPQTRVIIESLMTKSNGAKRLVPFNKSEVKEIFK